MLGFFPTPVQGESFYSCVSRYAGLLGSHAVDGYINNPKPSVGLPRRIHSFLRQLPPGHSFSTSQVIRDHTAYPYFAGFLTPLQRRQVLHYLTWGIHSNRGLHSWSLPKKIRRLVSQADTLRLCLGCVEDDKNAFGFATWKTLHHLPGVLVCPVHRQVLREVKRHVGVSNTLVAITNEVASSARAYSVLDWTLASEIAQMSYRLLAGRAATSPAIVRKRLTGLLMKRGFYDGTWRLDLLRNALLRRYGEEVLYAFGCGFACFISDRGWLAWLEEDEQLRPIEYLLLISFLEAD